MGRKRRALFVAAVLALALLLGGCAGAQPQTDSGAGTDLTVYCFSAGKADALLLYTADSAVLIDAGEKGFGKEIVAYLEEQGLARLDYLIITHFDKDHVGGAAKVLSSIPVGAVLQSNCPKDSSEYEKYLAALEAAALEPVTVRETLTFTLDGVAYTVDPPRQAGYSRNASNNSSLIVQVRNGQNRLLFAGDAQDERLEEFLSQEELTCDFLKVPYHGNWQDTLPELISAASPAYAVITSSDQEPEDERTLALLAESGVSVLLTREAPVVVHSDGQTLTAGYAEA